MTTRRRFLVIAGSAAAVASQACSAADSPASIGDVPAENLSTLPIGTLRAVDSQPVCIGRDSRGVYAMTLTCTHQGCDMGQQGSVSAQAITCFCHGSVFDANGNVVRGPASVPLAHFAVSVDAAGALTIHGETEVDPATRLPA